MANDSSLNEENPVWQEHYRRWNTVRAQQRQNTDKAWRDYQNEQAGLDGGLQSSSPQREQELSGKLRQVRTVAKVSADIALLAGQPAMSGLLHEVGDTANAAALGAGVGASQGMTGGALRAFAGNQAGGFAARRAMSRYGMGGRKAAALGGAVAGAFGGAARDPIRLAKNALRWLLRNIAFDALYDPVSYVPGLAYLDIDYLRTRNNSDPLSKFTYKQRFYLILANAVFFLALLLVFVLIAFIVVIIVMVIQQVQNVTPG